MVGVRDDCSAEITTSTAIPVIEVGLTGDVPYSLLRNVARRAEKALQNLPGVRSVTKYGYLDREIKVEIAQDALERYRVSSHETSTPSRTATSARPVALSSPTPAKRTS